MIETEQKVVYKAYGFSIISEINLPELPKWGNTVDAIDVEVVIDDLSKKWLELSDINYEFVINEKLVMFQVPNIATFSIEEGKKITVSPLKGYDEDIVRLYILGTSMGALLLQRRIFPLHGSAVAIKGKAYAFVGNSGAGKSTLASSFLNEGYQLITDDLIAVSLQQSGSVPFVTPAYPHQKLWQQSLDFLGMETKEYRSIYGRETKYSVPVASKYFTDPLPLGGVFELVKAENQEIGIRRIERLERFHKLYYHTYQNCLIQNSGLMDWHLNMSAGILKHIEIFQLARPVSGYSAPQLVTTILNIIKGE